jgi:hypothetical protein
MTNRTLIVLAGAFVVLSVLALVGQRNQTTTSAVTNVFFTGLLAELDRVELIELTKSGDEIFATLELGTEGWSVAERGDYPADTQKINHMLLSLAEAAILEQKTANPEWHDRLGVEPIERDNAGGIGIRLVGTDIPVNIIVGDSAGDGQIYARKADQAQSYLINRDPQVGRSTADWLDTEMLTIPENRIKQVKLQHPDGEILTIFKDEPGQSNFTISNIPENRELQYESVANTIGSTLSNLSLQDVELRINAEVASTLTEFRTFDGLILVVESTRQGDEDWITFNINYDSSNNPEIDDIVIENNPTVETEALELAQKLSRWRYRIPTYQFDQLTRRMNDLLRPLPDTP